MHKKMAGIQLQVVLLQCNCWLLVQL